MDRTATGAAAKIGAIGSLVVMLLGVAAPALSRERKAAAQPGPDPAVSCGRPLLSSDMSALDKVADGRLFLSELEPGELDCVVARLVRTKDPGVRDCFRWFIQNDVWEEVRAKLLALKERGGLDADVAERVDDLLAKEYSDDSLFVGGSLRYALERQRLVTTVDGASDRYAVETHSVRLAASADGAFNLGTWKLEPSLYASGTQLWSFERSSAQGGAARDEARSDQGAGGSAGLSLLRRDEKIKLSAYGHYNMYRDPPPDSSEESHGAGGSAQIREIGGSALSLKASADWYVGDLSPFGEGYFDPFFRYLSLYGEAAYMWEAAGLLGTYEHNDVDDIGVVSRTATVSDAGSLLVHVPVTPGYVRVGVGGGYWSEKSRQLGFDSSQSEGSEIHARLSGDFAATKSLHIDMSVEARANQSDGTFVGWYPSGSARLGASLSLGDLTLGAKAGISGDHRDLNLAQKSFSSSLGGDISYAPRDFFSISLSGGWNLYGQYGYEAQSSSCWGASAVVGFRVVKALDLWLNTEGDLQGSLYDAQGGYGEESSDAVILEQVSLRY
jgi:hypothetical protein